MHAQAPALPPLSISPSSPATGTTTTAASASPALRSYCSLDYEEGPYRQADLQRLDILVNGQPVDALARMVHR